MKLHRASDEHRVYISNTRDAATGDPMHLTETSTDHVANGRKLTFYKGMFEDASLTFDKCKNHSRCTMFRFVLLCLRTSCSGI